MPTLPPAPIAQRDILVILNPAARSTRAARQLKAIDELSQGATIALTSTIGDGKVLAKKAVEQGYRVVVAAGGDGTINEVVNGLAGSEVALGVLPVGTMNVFAAELGLPSRLREAWRVITEGERRAIDLASANRQHFVQLAGVGLDAQIVKETTWDMKRSLGPLSYFISAAKIVARKPPRIIVQADDRTEEGTFALVGNGRFYGGRLSFFQRAKIDDGLLDVLVFKGMGHFDMARYFAGVIMGNHTNFPDVVYLQAKRVRVESDESVPVEVDGELATELPVTFKVAHRKFYVMAPRSAPAA